MKLLKYFFYLMILSSSIYFLIELNELNKINGQVIHVKIPFLVESELYENGFNVWIVLVSTLTAGVFIGFFIALVQIISQKSEIISYRSKLSKRPNAPTTSSAALVFSVIRPPSRDSGSRPKTTLASVTVALVPPLS